MNRAGLLCVYVCVGLGQSGVDSAMQFIHEPNPSMLYFNHLLRIMLFLSSLTVTEIRSVTSTLHNKWSWMLTGHA